MNATAYDDSSEESRNADGTWMIQDWSCESQNVAAGSLQNTVICIAGDVGGDQGR